MFEKKDELLTAMLLKGVTTSQMAEALNITKQALILKMNGKRPFKQNELSIMIHLLGLTAEQAMLIFFSDKVDKKDNS